MTRRGRTGGVLTLLLVLLMAAGCSVVKGPNRPGWRVFALEPSPATAVTPAADDARAPVAVVGLPASGAGADTRRMAYSRGEGELEYYANHRWADTPARLLAPLLQRALERTGGFRAVAAAPTRARGDLFVESEILAFHQDINGERAQFRVALRVTVVHAAAPADFTSRVFRHVEPMPAAGPEEGVRAANRALANVLSEAAAFCAAQGAAAAE